MATENILVRLAMDTRDYVRGAAQARGATDDITQAASRTESGVGALARQYGGLAKAAAGAFVASRAVDFARDSIRAFSSLNESINAVKVQFGEGADAILDFGKIAAEQVGLSNAEFNKLSVSTGALLKSFISDSREAADETIRLTKRAADLASVYDIDVSEALGAFQSALRGETEPIRRFIGRLDDAEVRAKAVALGLAETTSEVSAQAKSMATLELIYERTDNTAGDFLNTQDSLANRQKTLASRFEDTKAAIGESLAPAMDGLLDVADALLPVFESLAPAVGSVGSALGDLAGPVATATGFLGTLVEKARIGGQFMFGIFPDGTQERLELGVDLLGESADAMDTLVEAVKKAPAEHKAAEQARIDEANAIDETREALRNESLLRARMAGQRPQEIAELRTTEQKYRDLADAIDDQNRAQADAEDQLRSLMAAQAEAANPLFRLRRANERATEAAKRYAEAVGDDVPGALADLIEAQADVEAAEAGLVGKVDSSWAAFQRLGRAAGIADDKIEEAARQLGIFPTSKTSNLNINVNTRYTSSGTPPPARVLEGTQTTTRIAAYAEGGDFRANEPMLVGEQGPELLIPTMAGSIIPNNQITGGTTNIYMEQRGDVYDDVSLALAMAGITEEIEWSGTSTLR